jgi:hypothetical protein
MAENCRLFFVDKVQSAPISSKKQASSKVYFLSRSKDLLAPHS